MRTSLRRRAYRAGMSRDTPRPILRDWCLDHFDTLGESMFNDLEIGAIIAVDTFGFPFVGRVVKWTDDYVELADAVKVLWDGRHGQFSQGKVPPAAEIEATYNPYRIPRDVILGWGPYPGPIPKPQ